ncbi:MAG: aminotransferase class V-fold PLP-dependent enzyme, partial [Spirochaetota bacterium]
MDQVANRCNGSFPFAGIIDDKKPYEYLNMVAFTVLETYSNVHRGTGHFSLITTELLEKARQVILSCILDDSCGYELIFCTPRRAAAFGERIGGEAYLSVSSGDIGLPLGVTAIAVRRGSLPRGVPFETGGGTVTLVSRWSAVYGRPPERFEAGTPAVINCVLFAAALLMTCSHGPDIFWRNQEIMNRTSVYDILYDDDYANLSGGKLLEALKRSITGRNLHVPYEGGYRRYVNFDNAASTPALTPVYNAASSVLNLPDNLTDDVIEETERIIYRFLDAGENQYSIFFCLNTTEALHIAVQNFVRGLPDGEEPVVV